MKKTILMLALALSASCLTAQNKVNLSLKGGNVESFNTTDVTAIDVEGNKVTLNLKEGNPKVYDGTLSSISFIRNLAGHVTLTEAAGWMEACYVEWENMSGANNYHVYVKGPGYAEYTRIDKELVRNYGSYGRADMPGLTPGSYTMKVVPVVNGTPMEEAAAETAPLDVKAFNRGGFAHFKYNDGIGAYNNDGTLKAGAKVFYVTSKSAKTITTQVITSSKGNTTTYTGIQDILDGYLKGYDNTPIVFRIVGCLHYDDIDKFSSSAEGIQIKNNKSGQLNITIEGIGNDATVHGFGFLLRNAESVELRNFGIMQFMDDAVSLDTDNSHCWVHNLDIYYGQKGSASDQAKGDGSIDVKTNSKYITIDNCHFWDSGKSSLCGMTKETGPNWITYHHNWFDHSDSRHPRIRTMSVHVYNNYYDGISKYGVGAAESSEAFAENNYFRDCKYPLLSSMQGSDIAGTFSGEDGGVIKSYGNIMRGSYTYRTYSESNPVEFDAFEASSRDEKVPATVTAKKGGKVYSNFDTDPELIYTYTPDAAEDVPSIVKGIYGAGRMNHGDFRWTFNNNNQDKNYAVIDALQTALRNYETTLVGFYEGDTSLGNEGVGSVNPGGDSSEGDEFPFGDGNLAGNTPVTPPVESGDAFMGTESDYLYFNNDAAKALVDNGTITFNGGSYKGDFTNTQYTDLIGALQLNKTDGEVIIKCPSIAVFKAKMFRTGTFAGKVLKSEDGGVTYSEVAGISGKTGVIDFDFSAQLRSDKEVYVKIINTSSGSLSILGLQILLAK
ncbi:MAG: pectate lyase [Lachnospiraceae bacterium]|nr:pectate lyase [Lachnospiraceae bacterium]